MTYEENYLAHYGVKGQRWGIRKYQNEDGSLTQLGKEHYSVGSGGNEKLHNQYKKELSRFSKLAAKADIDTQTQKATKYDERAAKAAKIGKNFAKATAASYLVGFGSNTAGRLLEEKLYRKSHEMFDVANAVRKATRDSTDSFAERLENKGHDFKDAASGPVEDARIAISQAAAAAMLTSAAGTVIAYGAAGYNKILSSVAKKRLSETGHAKAVAKRDAQYQKITNMVKDTPYAALFANQIAAYKKEHPNTELSDKQIMKNLM